MSQQNVELVWRIICHYDATGEPLAKGYSREFVWDMSKFRDWSQQPIYEGVEGAVSFFKWRSGGI